MQKITTQTIRKLKGQRPIVCVTAYDAIITALADAADVDLILVGDSVGTTLLGFDSTVPVTIEMIAHHTAAAARAKPKALLVSDIPFGLASHDFSRLLDGCMHLMQDCGAEAVKIEGGIAFADTISRLVDAGVPVLAHIGLLPQRVKELGGYRSFGKTDAGKARLIQDAKALEEAGAFAVLAEMIDPTLAKELSQQLRVPLIGIGAGPDCDGQILVYTDILGLTQGSYPSFAKRYANLSEQAQSAFSRFNQDVRERRFP